MRPIQLCPIIPTSLQHFPGGGAGAAPPPLLVSSLCDAPHHQSPTGAGEIQHQHGAQGACLLQGSASPAHDTACFRTRLVHDPVQMIGLSYDSICQISTPCDIRSVILRFTLTCFQVTPQQSIFPFFLRVLFSCFLFFFPFLR